MTAHPWWCDTFLCTVLEQYGAHRGLLDRVADPELLVEVWVEQRAGCPAFVGRRDHPTCGGELSMEGAETLAGLREYRALVVAEWNRAQAVR